MPVAYRTVPMTTPRHSAAPAVDGTSPIEGATGIDEVSRGIM
jgi:hypothetical protein